MPITELIIEAVFPTYVGFVLILALIVAGALVPLLLVVAFTVNAVDEIKRIRAARTNSEQ